MTERALKRFDQIAMRGFALLAIIALFARLFALPAMAEAHAGSVPFCGGGKITWVAIDGEYDPDASAFADPCPYLGLPIAPASPPPQTSLPERVWHVALPLARATQQNNRAPILDRRSRAPPQGF